MGNSLLAVRDINHKYIVVDWKEMYCNVWSRPESAKYMAWNLTTSEENAK